MPQSQSEGSLRNKVIESRLMKLPFGWAELANLSCVAGRTDFRDSPMDHPGLPIFPLLACFPGVSRQPDSRMWLTYPCLDTCQRSRARRLFRLNFGDNLDDDRRSCECALSHGSCRGTPEAMTAFSRARDVLDAIIIQRFTIEYDQPNVAFISTQYMRPTI